MPPVSYPFSMAGDYLTTTFADMMHAPSFRKHVWTKMQLAERRRLDALRLQALYGDAPVAVAASGGAANTTSGATAASTVDVTSEVTPQSSSQHTHQASAASSSADGMVDPPSHAAAVKGTPSASTSWSSLVASRPPAPPRWFDIAGRARYSAWEALRGRMSADVAAESFCAEFLSLVKKYPHPTLLPLIEAALSTAHELTCRSRAAPPRPLAAPSVSTAAAHSTSAATTPSSPPTAVLQVRALQGDPAALTLLWICRAYRLPCEFTVEPLSKALGAHMTGASTRTSPAYGVKRGEAANSCPTDLATINPYLSYTMADACYPFTVSLTQPAAAAAGASPSTMATTVTTPEAAFVLLTDTFLSDYSHWVGVPSGPVSAAALSPTSRLVQRGAWLDELQHITRHVRTPILALLVHQATQSKRLRHMSASAAAAERQHLLRAVAAHLHTHERWTMDRVLSRRVHQAQSVFSPLLASTAVVDCLRHEYAPDAKVVSATDAYVSSCGYTLCTHPFCADVFPFLRAPPVPVAALHDTVQAQWPSPEGPPSEAVLQPRRDSTTASYEPWALPLYLSGVPAECNTTINRLLRREANGAMRQERHQQPVRLFMCGEREAKVGHSSSSSSVGGGGGGLNAKIDMSSTQPQQQQQQQQQCRAGYYAISASSITKEAAEAVEKLILARMFSLRTDDLNSDSDAVGSTSSVSGVPFLVLGHVFALTWALCQEQVPGFPYFMLDGNPHHCGGYSFLSEDTEKKTSAASPSRARRRFQVTLSPAPVTAVMATADPGASMLPTIVVGASAVSSASSQDGGVSLESRLRHGWKAFKNTLAMRAARLSWGRRSEDERTVAGGGNEQSADVNATHVLCNEAYFTGATYSATTGAVRAMSRL